MSLKAPFEDWEKFSPDLVHSFEEQVHFVLVHPLVDRAWEDPFEGLEDPWGAPEGQLAWHWSWNDQVVPWA